MYKEDPLCGILELLFLFAITTLALFVRVPSLLLFLFADIDPVSSKYLLSYMNQDLVH